MKKRSCETARNSIIIGEGEAAASIDYSGNVDLSGRIDVDDVHLDHDVYNARYTLVSMVMHKFLNGRCQQRPEGGRKGCGVDRQPHSQRTSKERDI